MDDFYDVNEVTQLTSDNVVLLQQHPVLLRKYSELITSAIQALSDIDWVLEALAQNRHCFAPWCSMHRPGGISGIESEGVGQDGRDLICHCLVREDGSWITVLIHELRHLWQHVVAHQSYDQSIAYEDRLAEIDARSQEHLVENIDRDVLRRLENDARELDLAMSMAAAGLSIPDEI